MSVTNSDTQSGTLASSYTYTSAAVLQWQTGAASPNPPNPDNYGSTTVNVSHTYTLINNGDITSASLTLSKTGAQSGAWYFGTDNCTGSTLAASATCTVQVIFLAGVPLPSGSYSAILSATDGSSTTTNNMTGTVP